MLQQQKAGQWIPAGGGRQKKEKTEDERFEGDGWVHCHDCSNSINVYTGQNV